MTIASAASFGTHQGMKILHRKGGYKRHEVAPVEAPGGRFSPSPYLTFLPKGMDIPPACSPSLRQNDHHSADVHYYRKHGNPFINDVSKKGIVEN
ncbi:glutamine--fructose-6-phosphate transaminase [Sesbania bispinosa]|nr:glutamine--fructose-6-phosphate transaminase [Sesbania bispinosa]